MTFVYVDVCVCPHFHSQRHFGIDHHKASLKETFSSVVVSHGHKIVAAEFQLTLFVGYAEMIMCK